MKVKKGMGKRPGKVSLIKHSNKKYSKLLKRGQVKKNDRKLNMGSHFGKLPDYLRKSGKSIAEIDDGHLSEDDADVTDMLEENDDDNIDAMKNGFLKRTFNATEQKCKNAGRKRKKISDENVNEDEGHEFEKFPRRFESYEEAKSMRSVLPIKNKTGIIPQYVEIEESQAEIDNETVENGNDEEIEENGAGLNQPKQPEIARAYFRVDLDERKQKIISTYKLRIAQLASSIVGNPHTNMQSLRDLKGMLDDTEPIGYVYKQKLVMVSLAEVFKDIIPGYKLRSTGEDVKEQKLKKDVKDLREYEEGLLKHYKGYLQKLEAATRAISKKKRSDSLADDSDEKLGEIAIRCLCDLLVSHPHFNFRNNIIVTLVPFATSKNENVSNMCCNAMKMLYRQDRIGDASLEAVKQTTKLIKEKSYNVTPKLLDTFLVLKIKDAQFNSEEKSKKMTRKERQLKMSRREIKRSKQMQKLEKEMLETAAEESKQKKISFQTEVVKQVFLTYFRILKKAPSSTLLTAVLEGLAKYAHLINVEFFEDLIAVLHNLVNSGTLDYRQGLHCVQTVFVILSGQGEALNIDPYRFYTHMYKNLLSLHAGSSHDDDVPIALECLDMMINRRRKKVSYHRVLAFTKRLTTLALQLQHNGAIAVLALVRTFMQNHKRVDILLDTDTSQGSGTFLPELEEPEYCNAATTALWELFIMRSHYHPVVRKLAAHLATGAPIMGDGQLSQEISRRTPEELYEEFSPNNEEFNPPLDSNSAPKISKAKVKTKQRHWVPIFSQQYRDMISTLENIDLTKAFYRNK